MKDITVVVGPSSIELGGSIASKLGVEVVNVDLRTFNDGENKIRINTNLFNKKCIIVQSTNPPVDSNLLQTLMMISQCYNLGASEVIPVIPYMGYARQDRSFLEGELVTISLIAKLLKCVGIRNLITVDIHSTKALSYFDFNILNISSISSLAGYALQNFNLTNPVIVSPDLGGVTRAEEFASVLKTSFFALKKTRNRLTGDVVIDDNLDIIIKDRDIVIIDDMISSGGTILKAVEILKKNDCGKIYVMCVHALSDEKSLFMLKNSGISDIISTNSIPKWCSKVDLSSDITKALSSILVYNC